MPGFTTVPSDPEARRAYARLVGAKVRVESTRPRKGQPRKETLITLFPDGTTYEEPYDQRLLQDWQVKAIAVQKNHSMDFTFTAEL